MVSRQCVDSESEGRSPRPFFLTNLPEVPLDKIILYLSDDDLRRFHQVSRAWRDALESRNRQNRRRLDLVERIRENKENIRNLTHTLQEALPPAPPQRTIRERSSSENSSGKKTGNSVVLMECTNQVVNSSNTNTPTSAITTTTSAVSTPADVNNFLTPTSHFEFQEFQEAEKSLEEGQKLIQCRKCRGPVPSPVTPVGGSQGFQQEPKRLSSQWNRCKLFSKSDDHRQSPEPISPSKRQSKKAKTLSTSSLSPIPLPPPVTVASLGEIMSHSLCLSSPCLTIMSRTTVPPPRVSFVESECFWGKRSTSCSSITDVDISHQSHRQTDSSIDLNVSTLDDSPFYSSFPPRCNQSSYGMLGVDLSACSWNCARSCCSPRRVCNNSQLYTSNLSDSGLYFEGDSIDDFNNMMPSPTTVISPVVTVTSTTLGEHNSNSIERARNVSNYSDGALSASSYSHLQRSDHSLNFSNYDHNNTESVLPCVLECPNPNCGYRFCSQCEENEHPERPCHMVSSDQFESFDGSNNSSNIFGNTNNNSNNFRENSNSNCKTSKKGNNSKSNKQKCQKKTPLRRIARL